MDESHLKELRCFVEERFKKADIKLVSRKPLDGKYSALLSYKSISNFHKKGW